MLSHHNFLDVVANLHNVDAMCCWHRNGRFCSFSVEENRTCSVAYGYVLAFCLCNDDKIVESFYRNLIRFYRSDTAQIA